MIQSNRNHLNLILALGGEEQGKMPGFSKYA